MAEAAGGEADDGSRPASTSASSETTTGVSSLFFISRGSSGYWVAGVAWTWSLYRLGLVARINQLNLTPVAQRSIAYASGHPLASEGALLAGDLFDLVTAALVDCSTIWEERRRLGA